MHIPRRGKFTYLPGLQQRTNQQSGNEIEALWVKLSVIPQDGGKAIVLISVLSLSRSTCLKGHFDV